jgi:ABC-type Zn uptake system ZnuABC Zn-binding protein ZnuA
MLGLALGLGLVSAAPVRVVTTIPDLADWVRNVGGDRVVVQSLITGSESPHTYEPGPDAGIAIAEADLLVKVGLGLEEWLDGLVANAGNKRLAIVDVSERVEVIKDVEGHGAGGEAGGHPFGNPHIWLDPQNAKAAADVIASALSRIDSAGAAMYQASAQTYGRRLDSLTDALNRLVQPLLDRRFISYHESWPYFARRFGFQVVASIEPLPGQEPSARYMAGLVDLVKSSRVKAVCTEPQLPQDVPSVLASETGAKLVMLSPITGALPGTGDYFSMLTYDVRHLVAALSDGRFR